MKPITDIIHRQMTATTNFVSSLSGIILNLSYGFGEVTKQINGKGNETHEHCSWSKPLLPLYCYVLGEVSMVNMLACIILPLIPFLSQQRACSRCFSLAAHRGMLSRLHYKVFFKSEPTFLNLGTSKHRHSGFCFWKGGRVSIRSPHPNVATLAGSRTRCPLTQGQRPQHVPPPPTSGSHNEIPSHFALLVTVCYSLAYLSRCLYLYTRVSTETEKLKSHCSESPGLPWPCRQASPLPHSPDPLPLPRLPLTGEASKNAVSSSSPWNKRIYF